MVLRTITALILCIVFLSAGCGQEEAEEGHPDNLKVFPPQIRLNGRTEDTVCLPFTYIDPGAEVVAETRGKVNCTVPVRVTGTVNSAVTGSYVLFYDVVDVPGPQLPTATRTVHVVENNSAGLNGVYNVACSCTAGASPQSIVTTDHYVAAVSSGSANGSFKLSALRIGPEYITPSAFLRNEAINISYFSVDYHHASAASATLSPDKSSFTVESTFYQWTPALTYVCRNIFTNSRAKRSADKS